MDQVTLAALDANRHVFDTTRNDHPQYARVDGSLQSLASTGVSGFSLVASGVGANNLAIIQHTFPSDGKLHRGLIFATLQVISAMTGGVTGVQVHLAGGSYDTGPVLYNANGGVGYYHYPANPPSPFLVFGGDTIQVVQASNLTVGTATLYAEIWGL